jgi:YbbR domain-containing protein
MRLSFNSDYIPRFIKNINVGRLLISLGLAVIVWGYVTATQYPEKTLPPVELTLAEPIPPPSDLEVVPSAQPQTVKVTISGLADQVATLIPSQIKPYIDLSDLKQPGPHDVPVKIKPGSLPSGVVAKIEPQTIPVLLEKRVSKTFPVEIVRIGEINPDYYLDGDIPPPSPAQVTVAGRESVMGNVAKAQVVVNLAGRVGTLRTSPQVQLVDAKGQVIDDKENDLTINPTTVNVTVNITYKLNSRTVPIRVITKGEPASGFIAGAAQTNPVLVTVTSGSKDALDKVEYVETDPVDITGANSEISKTVLINPPSNVTIQGDNQVRVRIGIVPFQASKTISVQFEHRNEASNLRYTYSSSTINLTISGPYQAFQPDLPLDSIKAFIDVQGRSVGSYDLPVQVDLPPNLVVTNSPTVKVTISPPPTPTRVPPTPTPLPPTPTPTPTRTPPPTATPTVPPATTPNPNPNPTPAGTAAAVASPSPPGSSNTPDVSRTTPSPRTTQASQFDPSTAQPDNVPVGPVRVSLSTANLPRQKNNSTNYVYQMA